MQRLNTGILKVDHDGHYGHDKLLYNGIYRNKAMGPKQKKFFNKCIYFCRFRPNNFLEESKYFLFNLRNTILKYSICHFVV